MASPVSEVRPSAARHDAVRVLRSFGFAWEGLVTIFRTQPNFRVHVVAACLALGLGLGLRVSAAELAILLLVIALVLAVESLNTAIEAICDLVSPGQHPLVKRAKDISAGAVLIAAMGAVSVAVVLFGPRLLGLLP